MMPAVADEERRRCLPVASWPAADRQGWEQAIRKGDLLLDDGPAAGLRPLTRRRHAQSYGRWLGWLERTGRLDPTASPGARGSREAILGYIAELQALNASGTVLVRLQSLAAMLRWLAPGKDWSWLRPVLARLEAMARPIRDKRPRLQSPADLLALGRRLMAEAASATLPEAQRARLHRDGLMIAFLACRPLRLGNLIRLELGRHLVRQGEGWWIEIPGPETKTRQPISLPFPTELVPALEDYLQHWRPKLASPAQVARSPALWLTAAGGPISSTRANLVITQHTARAFGRPVNPHLFRDALATSVAVSAPEQVGIVTPLLGHRSLATAQKYYNLAGMTEAAEAWHKVLDQIGEGSGPRTGPR